MSAGLSRAQQIGNVKIISIRENDMAAKVGPGAVRRASAVCRDLRYRSMRCGADPSSHLRTDKTTRIQTNLYVPGGHSQ